MIGDLLRGTDERLLAAAQDHLVDQLAHGPDRAGAAFGDRFQGELLALFFSYWIGSSRSYFEKSTPDELEKWARAPSTLA